MKKTRCNQTFIHGEEHRDVTTTRGTLIKAAGFHCLPEGSNPRSDSTDQNAISSCIIKGFWPVRYESSTDSKFSQELSLVMVKNLIRLKTAPTTSYCSAIRPPNLDQEGRPCTHHSSLSSDNGQRLFAGLPNGIFIGVQNPTTMPCCSMLP
jgi:hypothetical protein